MKFLVQIDNGEEYSDYEAVAGCICNDEDEADTVVMLFNQWKYNLLAELSDEDGYIDYCDEERVANALAKFPCPIPDLDQRWGDWSYLFRLYKHNCWHIKVPEWCR